MNIDVIAEWFKTSLVGIILLGALGSILAVAILKLAFPTLRIAGATGRFVIYLSRLISVRSVYVTDRFLEECHATRNTISAILFLAFRLVRAVAATAGVALCVNTAIWAFAQSPKSDWLYLSVWLGFMLAMAVLWDLATLISAYSYFVARPLDKLKEKHKDEIAAVVASSKVNDKNEKA